MKYRCLAFALIGAVTLAALGCHSVGPQHNLILSMVPAEMRPGQILVVTAQPVPPANLLWVSGTVNVMGFPDMAFSKDAKDGLWKIKTMIPIFTSVAPGDYEAKAWGLSKDGQRYDGTFNVHVK